MVTAPRSTVLVLALVFALGVACGDGDVVVPAPPGHALDGTTVFVFDVEGTEPEVVVAAGDEARLFAAPLRREGRSRVIALQYEAAPSALGLRPGPLAAADPEACGALPLPTEGSLHELSVEDGRAGGWRALDARPQVVADLRVEGPCPCHGFVEVKAVPSPITPLGAFGRGEDERLLLAEDGSFWRLSADATFARVDTATAAPEGTVTAAAEEGDGTLWLATEAHVFRGDPFAGFEPAFDLVTSNVFTQLHGGQGPDGFELYGATQGGFLVRLLPGPVETITAPQVLPVDNTTPGRVLWLGPRRVMASEARGVHVFWVEDDVEVARAEVPPELGGVYLLRQLPGLGGLVVTRDSRIFEVDGYRLRLRNDAPELSTPRTLVPFEGGYLYAGIDGYLQQFVPGYGFCPTRYLEGRNPVRTLLTFGDRIIALTASLGDAPWQAILLEPVPPEP